MSRIHEVLYARGVLNEDAKLTSPIGFQVSEIPLEALARRATEKLRRGEKAAAWVKRGGEGSDREALINLVCTHTQERERERERERGWGKKKWSKEKVMMSGAWGIEIRG
ncbi:hypothetical protein Syun_028056 [Stephania yunnanensis]|uniref:Uncharacterized protein n=1 Tax=Stephania yunnanensis TaxID=152371 RepID=A0AAP0EGP1_9MAGN